MKQAPNNKDISTELGIGYWDLFRAISAIRN